MPPKRQPTASGPKPADPTMNKAKKKVDVLAEGTASETAAVAATTTRPRPRPKPRPVSTAITNDSISQVTMTKPASKAASTNTAAEPALIVAPAGVPPSKRKGTTRTPVEDANDEQVAIVTPKPRKHALTQLASDRFSGSSAETNIVARLRTRKVPEAAVKPNKPAEKKPKGPTKKQLAAIAKEEKETAKEEKKVDLQRKYRETAAFEKYLQDHAFETTPIASRPRLTSNALASISTAHDQTPVPSRSKVLFDRTVSYDVPIIDFRNGGGPMEVDGDGDVEDNGGLEVQFRQHEEDESEEDEENVDRMEEVETEEEGDIGEMVDQPTSPVRDVEESELSMANDEFVLETEDEDEGSEDEVEIVETPVRSKSVAKAKGKKRDSEAMDIKGKGTGSTPVKEKKVSAKVAAGLAMRAQINAEHEKLNFIKASESAGPDVVQDEVHDKNVLTWRAALSTATDPSRPRSHMDHSVPGLTTGTTFSTGNASSHSSKRPHIVDISHPTPRKNSKRPKVHVPSPAKAPKQPKVVAPEEEDDSINEGVGGLSDHDEINGKEMLAAKESPLKPSGARVTSSGLVAVSVKSEVVDQPIPEKKRRKTGKMGDYTNDDLPTGAKEGGVWKNHFMPTYFLLLGHHRKPFGLPESEDLTGMQVIWDSIYDGNLKIVLNSPVYAVAHSRAQDMRHVMSSAALTIVTSFYELSTDYMTTAARQAHSLLMLQSNAFLYKQASPPAGLLRGDFITQTLAAYYQHIDGCYNDIAELHALKFFMDSPVGAIGLAAASVERGFKLWAYNHVEVRDKKPKVIRACAETQFSSTAWSGAVDEYVDVAIHTLNNEARAALCNDAMAVAKAIARRAARASSRSATSEPEPIAEPPRPIGRRTLLVDAPLRNE